MEKFCGEKHLEYKKHRHGGGVSVHVYVCMTV